MLNKCAEIFANNLNEKKLRFETGTTSRGDSVVEFPYNGKTTKIFFSGDDGTSLSLYMIFETIPEEKLADLIFLCNTLNSEYKWIKFYVDKDNDLVLQEDAILSVDDTGEEAFELLLRMVKLADELKPQIMKAIYA